MRFWEMLKGPRAVLKKVKFLYEPYRKAKVDYVTKKKRKALQKRGIEIIDMVETALTEYGVAYFADYGTLLGIIRDHDFIKWDNDLDYGIIIDDEFNWEDFEKHMNQHRFNKIREFRLSGKVKEQTYKRNVLTVDFFAKSYENNELVTYGFFKKQDYPYKFEQDYHVRKVKYVKITGIKQVPFLGTYVTVPENAEEYLESVYTKYWRIPDPQWDDEADNRKVEVLNTLGVGIVKE